MKIKDTERRLLAAAAAREDGQLFPLPSKLSSRSRDGVIRRLIEAKLVVAAPANSDDQVWREDDGNRLSLLITQYARDILAAEQDGINLTDVPMAGDKPAAGAVPASKIGRVLVLLRREQGASLEEIGRATGWLEHSVRAALTALRKKGHAIERYRRDAVTVYYLKRED